MARETNILVRLVRCTVCDALRRTSVVDQIVAVDALRAHVLVRNVSVAKRNICRQTSVVLQVKVRCANAAEGLGGVGVNTAVLNDVCAVCAAVQNAKSVNLVVTRVADGAAVLVVSVRSAVGNVLNEAGAVVEVVARIASDANVGV